MVTAKMKCRHSPSLDSARKVIPSSDRKCNASAGCPIGIASTRGEAAQVTH